jgi:hypothetical protein
MPRQQGHALKAGADNQSLEALATAARNVGDLHMLRREALRAEQDEEGKINKK